MVSTSVTIYKKVFFPTVHSIISDLPIRTMTNLVIKCVTVCLWLNWAVVTGFRQEGFVACKSGGSGFSHESSDDFMSDRGCLELCRAQGKAYSLRKEGTKCLCSSSETVPGTPQSSPADCAEGDHLVRLVFTFLCASMITWVSFHGSKVYSVSNSSMLTSCYELVVRYATFFNYTFEFKSTVSDEKIALKCLPRGTVESYTTSSPS